MKIQQSFCRVNDIDISENVFVCQLQIIESILYDMVNEFLEVRLKQSKYLTSVLQPFRVVWMQMADEISKYTVGTGVNRSRFNFKWSDSIFHPVRLCYYGISRYYMGIFQDFAVQNEIDTIHGIFPPGYDTVPGRMQLRNLIILSDYSCSMLCGGILLLKRYTAPRSIDNLARFSLACIW